jgi:WD40-like Beta Propeller Repeat
MMAGQSRIPQAAAVLIAAIALLALLAAPASAGLGREFKEIFGSAEQPAFPEDSEGHGERGLAVDEATGDLFVIDAMAGSVSRFEPSGVPDPFSALGTNVIDGSETPQGGLSFGSANEVQVAVAPPGAVAGTAGNIYVTQAGVKLIDVFAPSGQYLGQLTKAGGANFGEPCGVTVDEAGSVYVGDYANNRVYKFVPTSNPPLDTDSVSTFDGTVEHPCTLAAGAAASAGAIFVAGYNALSGSGDDLPVSKLDSTSGKLDFVIEGRPTTVAVDPSNGDVLVGERSEVKEYDASGASSAALVWQSSVPSTVEGVAANSLGEVYLSRANLPNIEVYGPLVQSLPQIEAEWAAEVDLTEATLHARFGPEEEETTYYVEYLSQAAFEGNGNSFSGDNSPLRAPIFDATIGSTSTVSVTVKGLQPKTVYRYRFIATNPAGTTEGQGRAFTTLRPFTPVSDLCPNDAFRTDASAFLPDCRAYEMVSPIDKNGGDIVSTVSTAEDAGGYVQASPDGDKITYTAFVSSFAGQPNSFAFNQYLASRQEEGGGWSNQGIHHPVPGSRVDISIFGIFREFMAFSPDLCDAWLVDFQTPAPTTDGQPGYRNLYRRENCGAGAGSLEAMTPAPPPLPAGTIEHYVDNRSVQGVSADARHALFVARAKLTDEAAPDDGDGQVYDRFGGENHLVSVLPDGSPGDPAAGDGMGFADKADSAVGSGWIRNLEHAVSSDGSRVYWTSDLGNPPEGQIYLRLHPEQGLVEDECTPGKACTLPVNSGTSTPGSVDAFFWKASPDGSKALYSESGDLYEFDLARLEAKDPEPSQLLTSQVMGVVGASDDLARVYFVSTDALSGAQPVDEGEEAQAGQPNLYLVENGEFTFIATLANIDIGLEQPDEDIAYNLISGNTRLRATRVTPDGKRLVFQSRASLTGYDNADAESGTPAVEVFTYQAGGDLECVSCDPSGARPRAGQLREPYAQLSPSFLTPVLAAAWIPTWEHPLHASNVLSEDGGRIFFNSKDALLPRDTNGAQDVYEWEAPGTGSCEEGDEDYLPQNGGCLYLISTGESPSESEFWEASPDGADAFFTTASSLVPQDPGSIDLYDARVEGGFPAPIVKSPCEGEACQSPPAPPGYATPASSAYRGPGNVAPPKRCRKGKRKVRRAGKTRCVRKKRRHAKRRKAKADKRRANRERRAER